MKTPVWIVKSVEPKNDYTLHLTFADGTKKVYNARPLLDKAIYTQLRNITFFMNAKVECGTVVWNDDIDIAPEHLYEYSSLSFAPLPEEITPDNIDIAMLEDIEKNPDCKQFVSNETAMKQLGLL